MGASTTPGVAGVNESGTCIISFVCDDIHNVQVLIFVDLVLESFIVGMGCLHSHHDKCHVVALASLSSASYTAMHKALQVSHGR